MIHTRRFHGNGEGKETIWHNKFLHAIGTIPFSPFLHLNLGPDESCFRDALSQLATKEHRRFLIPAGMSHLQY